MKQIKLGAKSWDEAKKSTELAALRQLRHPFIVRLKELLRNSHDGSLWLAFGAISKPEPAGTTSSSTSTATFFAW